MAKFQRSPKNPWLLVVLLLLGGLAGSALGQLLTPTFSFLSPALEAALKPSTLDLRFFTVTFGFSVDIGLLTLVGFIVGYLVYRRV